MNLSFNKVSGVGYVATATINAVSKLHVVRTENKPFKIFRSSVSPSSQDDYCGVDDTGIDNWGKVVDCELVASSFPVYLKFVSQAPVTSAQLL